MISDWRSIIWRQLGAAIDTLENALLACPEELWGDRSQRAEFWYVVYHTLFFLDFYSSESPEGFAPPAPFTMSEMDPAGVLPERVYTKGELHTYLKFGREKCRARVEALTEDQARERCPFERREATVAELILYNMRHVQHHAAQLNFILREKTDSAPPWISKAAGELGRDVSAR